MQIEHEKKPVRTNAYSNLKQIQLGKQLAKSSDRSFQALPKWRKVLRKTAQLNNAEQQRDLTFKATKIGIQESQRTIDLVMEKHMRFIHGRGSHQQQSPRTTRQSLSPRQEHPQKVLTSHRNSHKIMNQTVTLRAISSNLLRRVKQPWQLKESKSPNDKFETEKADKSTAAVTHNHQSQGKVPQVIKLVPPTSKVLLNRTALRTSAQQMRPNRELMQPAQSPLNRQKSPYDQNSIQRVKSAAALQKAMTQRLGPLRVNNKDLVTLPVTFRETHQSANALDMTPGSKERTTTVAKSSTESLTTLTSRSLSSEPGPDKPRKASVSKAMHRKMQEKLQLMMLKKLQAQQNLTRRHNSVKVQYLIAKVQEEKKMEEERVARLHLVSNKHEAEGEQHRAQTLYLKKRLAQFAPDFSINSSSVEKLTKQMDHLKQCKEDIPSCDFNLPQELANKALEIVQQEISSKTSLRNHSALNMPNKQKMELQVMNKEHGITQYEQARMAMKLLVNHGKKAECINKQKKAEKEEISRKHKIIQAKLHHLASPKEGQQSKDSFDRPLTQTLFSPQTQRESPMHRVRSLSGREGVLAADIRLNKSFGHENDEEVKSLSGSIKTTSQKAISQRRQSQVGKVSQNKDHEKLDHEQNVKNSKSYTQLADKVKASQKKAQKSLKKLAKSTQKPKKIQSMTKTSTKAVKLKGILGKFIQNEQNVDKEDTTQSRAAENPWTNQKIRLTQEQANQLQAMKRPATQSQNNLSLNERRKRDFFGIPVDKQFESESLQEEFSGQQESRNGLSSRMLKQAKKKREDHQAKIKDALSSVECIIRDNKYSFYKKNPNLLVPQGGLLMMREKSTMEVIRQIGQAGQLSLLEAQKINERALNVSEMAKRQTMIEQMKHNLNYLDF